MTPTPLAQPSRPIRAERVMLGRVISLKLGVTVAWIAGCCAPTPWLAAIGFQVDEPAMFLRLLGAAYLGLWTGYWIGRRQVLSGERAPATVGAGIVSKVCRA